VGLAQQVSTAEDTQLGVTLSATDVDNAALTYSIVPGSGPAHGTLSGTAPNLIYKPNANYHGPDSFAFLASDGTASSAPVTVTIEVTPVNDAPVALNVAAVTAEDTAKPITLAATDVENNPLTYSYTQPQLGTGTVSGTGPQLIYTPPDDFEGTATFTYTALDGLAVSNVATVSIVVTSQNDPPIAAPVSASGPEDTSVSVVLLGTDEESTVLNYVVTPPSIGTLSGIAPNLTYTPPANFHGVVTFSYQADDGGEPLSNSADVTITITPVNDLPVAAPVVVTTPEDTPITFTFAGSDVDGDELTYSYNGLTEQGPTLTFTPPPNFFGPVTFTYTAHDGTGSSNVAMVTINVTPVNDQPVVGNQEVETFEGIPVEITLSASDVESSSFSFSIESDPSGGTLSIIGSKVIYTPNSDFSGTDSFTYRASDGLDDSNVATVFIDVISLNDPPLVGGGAPVVITTEGTPASNQGTFSDPDLGDIVSLTVSPVGDIVVDEQGNWTWSYEAADDFGPGNVTITASDGEETATFVFRLTVLNAPPQIVPLSFQSSSTEASPKVQGQSVSVQALFSDPGLADTHTATILWGDGSSSGGSISQPAGLASAAGGQKQVDAEHIYAQGGIYTVTITLRDDNGGADAEFTTTVIAGAGLHGTELQIIGTSNVDIALLYSFGDTLTVHTVLGIDWCQTDDDWDDDDSVSQNWGGYGISYKRLDVPRAAVERILVKTFGGHDYVLPLWGISQPMTADGGAGNDWLVTGSGADIVTDLSGKNRIYTGAGNDTVTTGDGDDRIWTDGGNDTVNAGGGSNDVYTDGGDDYVVTGDGADTIEAGSGNDRVYAGGGNDTVYGGDGHDILVGGAGNDRVVGNRGRDLLIGGLGADTIEGAADEDIMIAGYTLYDANDEALQSILAEWTSSRTALQRVFNLSEGTAASGLDGSKFSSRLNTVNLRISSAAGKPQTVFDDGVMDTLIGASGLDWLLYNFDSGVKDKLTGNTGGDVKSDIDPQL
jgi:hypothetical protein